MANRAHQAQEARSSQEANSLQEARALQEAHSLQATQRATQRVPWLWMIILGVVLLTGPVLLERARIEHDNRTVELVVDLESIRALSAYTNVSVDELLADWAARGITSVGISEPDDIVYIDAIGLRVVPRTIAVLAALEEGGGGADVGIGVGPFIAAGDEMPGYPDRLADVAAMLDRADVPLGIVEFANQPGERELARLLGDVVVFVHSIPPRELVHLSDEQALARFNRAVLERQARVLYIHPLLPAADASVSPSPIDREELLEELLARNAEYVSALVNRVGELELAVGPARPLPRWTSPVWIPAAVMVAAAAAALLVGRAFVRLSWKWEAAVLVAAVTGTVLLVTLGRDVLARQAAAFAVACVFPVLAVATGVRLGEGGHSATDVGKRFGTVFGITVLGAALVVAALADTRFFLKLEQFRGVKLAHLLPMGLVAVIWLSDAVQSLGLHLSSPSRTRTERARLWLASLYRLVWPIGWRHVLVAIVVAGAAFVLVARTGHYVLPVPAWERAAREALERWLVVRPRTKEFLLGYPALVIGLVAFVGGYRNLAWPLLIAGSVASISVINTFAHAHVALSVSVVRMLYGMLFGVAVALVGLAVLGMWRRLSRIDDGQPMYGHRAHRPGTRG